jgi:phage tail tape-measure protein
MREDTGEGADEAMLGTGSPVVTQTITPREGTGELVQRCTSLLGQCSSQLVRRGATAIVNAEACGRLLRTRGVTLICGAVGGFVGRWLGGLAGGAVGSLGGPVGTAVGGAAGSFAGARGGRWLGQQGCRWLTGSTQAIEELATRECFRAASDAVMESAQSSQQCRAIASSCRP